MTYSEYQEIMRRIDNATTTSELRALREWILENFDEDDPDVKVLVKKL